MTFSECRLVPWLLLLATAPAAAQGASRLDAGAGTGGSAFGWQPRVGLSGEMQAASLGSFRTLFAGALDRVAAPAAFQYDAFGGVRLASVAAPMGWWVGMTAVHRNGFKDIVEQPRIETGGWRRVGNLVVTISAVRRSAAMSGYFSRSVTGYNTYYDSSTGHWDTTRVERTVGDSARRSERWAETQATVAWEGRRASAEIAMGGRLASHNVPTGVWASGNIAVRLSAPLALVIGAGSSTGGQFALDAEHRFVTLGLRISPYLTSSIITTRPMTPAAALSAFAVDALGGGRYRITLTARRAHRVEVSGDFTGWKPVPLEGAADGGWTVTLPLTAGAHRLNARVDGGGWIAPPGLTTISDDFAGEVGVLVVEPLHEPEGARK